MTRPGTPRGLRATVRLAALALRAGWRTALFGGSLVVVLVLGIIATEGTQPPGAAVLPPNVTAALVSGCDTSEGTIGVTWQIDATKATPPVTGVTLTGVPWQCAALPITTSLLDASGGVIASKTNPPEASGGTATVSVFFELTDHPGGGVAIPPIEGILAEIPDPFTPTTPLVVTPPSGTDVTVAALATASDGTTVPISLAIPEVSGGTVTFAVSTQAPPAAGFSAGGVNFDISLSGITVSPSQPLILCLFLDPGVPRPALLHYAGGAWVTLESAWNPATGELCATVTSLSPFALGTLPTTTTAGATPSSVAVNSPVTVSASVSGLAPNGAGGSLDPEGTVAFSYCYGAVADPGVCTSGGTAIGSAVSLAGGANTADGTATASVFFTPTAAGYYRFRASFSHTDSYLDSSGATSAPVVAIGGGTPAPTTTSTTVSPRSITLGRTVVDTATVRGAVANGTGGLVDPSGAVTFTWCYGGASVPTSCPSGTQIGSAVALAGGKSASDGIATAKSAPWLPLQTGWYLLHASYGGDVLYAGSADNGTNEAFYVGPAPTRTRVTSTPAQPLNGQSVTLAATVVPSHATIRVTGTIVFTDQRPGGVAPVTLGTCALAPTALPDGSAACSITLGSLPLGNHKIVASFTSTDGFRPSDGSRSVKVVLPKL